MLNIIVSVVENTSTNLVWFVILMPVISQATNPEEDDAQTTLNDVNDDELLNITEVLERTNLSWEDNLPELNLEQKRDEEKKYHDKPIQPII